MSLLNLICPHCGGAFELDKDRALQPFLTCPYCGNRSLMQKSEDSIRLRGIISSRSQPAEAAAAIQMDKPDQPARMDQPAQQLAAGSPVLAAVGSLAAGLPETAGQTEAETLSSAEKHRGWSLEDIIAETQANAPPLIVQPEQPAAAAPLPSPAAPAVPSKQAPAVPSLQTPVTTPEKRPSEQKPPEQKPPEQKLPEQKPPESMQPEQKPLEKKSVVATLPDFDQLCSQAEDAAARHDMPLFNAYSRQAVDRRPTHPRMYALRAVLTEEADGFARATWTSPTWELLSPLRKQAVIAQQLYNLNTALKFSRADQQQDLINKIAWQLVRQVIEFFTEQAEIRCSRRPFLKKFKGRYHRADLLASPFLLEAFGMIDKRTCPLGWQGLLGAIRIEINNQAPKRIARRLRHL
ncbi:MAG TPA: hypothetical protein DD640_06370 [Clostridiales bacterium]|nr:hypothetical protein [Clostridiales bacterium]